jgi:ribonuclease P protein component
MLAKKNRADRKNIDDIFKRGRFVNSPNLSLKFISTRNSTPARISFIAPKTASKKAVVRNLLRRRGYAVLKKHLKHFPSGFTGAFIFGKKSAEVFSGRKTKNYNPIQNLDDEVKTILNKLH